MPRSVGIIGIMLPRRHYARAHRRASLAYDVASTLVGGGVLPELTYRRAVETFGYAETGELCYLVGLYCLISVILNGFGVPVSEPTA